MTHLSEHVNIGDIIRSESFAYGVYGTKREDSGHLSIDTTLITIEENTKNHKIQYFDPNSPYRNPTLVGLEVGAYSPDRSNQLFVVEHAKYAGGGYAMANDYYPDGWEVKARQLSEDGKYDPNGQLICFMQEAHWFTHYIGEVDVVGKMDKKTIKRGSKNGKN